MSCRHSRLSKEIEAFISRISAEGPSANRPPHIALESDRLRPEPLVIFGLLALLPALAGCDRQKAEAPQGEPPAADPTAAAEPYPTGRLDRSHAGTPAPGTVFEDPHGRPARIADFRSATSEFVSTFAA